MKALQETITPQFDLDRIITGDQFWCITKLSNNRLAGGCKDGAIYMYQVSITSNTFERLLCNSSAHRQGIYVVKEIAPNKMISSSRDSTIKLWDISEPKSMKEIRKFTGHADDVYHVVYVNHNENVQNLISCSFWDGSLLLWNVNEAQNSKKLYCNKDEPPRCLVHLKERNYLLVSIAKQTGEKGVKEGHVDVYNTLPNECKFVRRINNVFTNWRFGMVGVSKDYVFVSMDKPEAKISLIDVEQMKVVDEIKNAKFIEEQGSMVKLKENVALYARKGKFFQLSVKKQQEKDKTAKIGMDHTKEFDPQSFRAGGGIIMFDSKHFVTNSDYEQLTIYEVNYLS